MEFERLIAGTPFVRPYLFDNEEKADSTVYLDRMEQWDQKKYDKCCIKNFGRKVQMLEGIEPEKIESFLCDYFGEKVMLCRIETGKRQDNGYPWYRIDYKDLV